MSDLFRSSKNPFKIWSNEHIPPRDFLKSYPLPQVARITEAGPEAGKSSSRLDLRQPFLMYKSYNSVKVHARSIAKDSKGHAREVGPTVVIPEDYTGWFAIVTDNGRTAPYFSTIEQVVNAHVPYFLVRNDVQAYKVSDPRLITGKTSYAKTTVKTGHVLKLVGVYEDINSRQYKNRNRISKSNGNVKYAQCVNYKGEVLFLSFSCQGKFYATATRGARSVNHVFLISHLLRTVKFPVTVRLVCGFLPKVPCNFTGILRLQNARREDIILACTMLKERNVMLEIDVNSSFSLCKALHEETYAKSDLYLGALAFCADEADIWRRQMKVVHHVYPDSSTPSGGVSGGGLLPFRRSSAPPSLPMNHNNNGTHASSGSGGSGGSGTSSSGSGVGGPSSSTCSPLRKLPLKKSASVSNDGRHETQSVCISMIFDELDDDEEPDIDNPGRGPQPIKPVTTTTPSGTKFWTLRRLKQLAQTEAAYDSPYSMLKNKESIYEVIDDGSENANDEFTTRLNKNTGKWYLKLPGLAIPEDGSYVVSQKTEAIYDSIC